MREADEWTAYAKEYDKKVFSLTSFPKRRRRVLENVSVGRVLNLGTGPTSYLNKDLIAQGNAVVAGDFCRAMLEEAEKRFTHPRLSYVLTDARESAFVNESFDSVVSINSILPPERENVVVIVREAFRVLKPNGVFIAFLTSYDSTVSLVQRLKLEMLLDPRDLRVNDGAGSGWQCYHTPKSIEKMLDAVGRSGHYNRIYLDTPEEVAELKRIYDIDTAEFPIHEYLLVAWKM